MVFILFWTLRKTLFCSAQCKQNLFLIILLKIHIYYYLKVYKLKAYWALHLAKHLCVAIGNMPIGNCCSRCRNMKWFFIVNEITVQCSFLCVQEQIKNGSGIWLQIIIKVMFAKDRELDGWMHRTLSSRPEVTGSFFFRDGEGLLTLT